MLIVLFIVRWFITGMSAEKISSTEVNNLHPLTTPEKSEEVLSSGRVDINVLLDRARKTQEKENFTKFIFIGLTLCLIFIIGMILSF
tara:strand:+ start:193 stop:453 length:261 start_codon:yes stop_codon:yes gene_type:complete